MSIDNHVFRYGGDFAELVVERAQGAYFYDGQGRAILDFTSGQMSSILGHSHPEIVDVVTRGFGSLDHLHSSFLSDPVLKFADDLAGVLPETLSKVLPLSTGGESNEAALDVLMLAIERAGFRLGDDVYLGLDVAASELFDKQERRYRLSVDQEAERSSDDMVDWCRRLVEMYPILSIEDGLDETDWEGWAALTAAIGRRVQLVGDDLFVTNTGILARGIRQSVANSILIKLNQIGTLTETLAAIDMARQASYTAIVSHRSGETEDTTISDVAVATNAGQIKTGSLCRTDRTAKYNQLLRIERQLGDRARYPGAATFINLPGLLA